MNSFIEHVWGERLIVIARWHLKYRTIQNRIILEIASFFSPTTTICAIHSTPLNTVRIKLCNIWRSWRSITFWFFPKRFFFSWWNLLIANWLECCILSVWQHSFMQNVSFNFCYTLHSCWFAFKKKKSRKWNLEAKHMQKLKIHFNFIYHMILVSKRLFCVNLFINIFTLMRIRRTSFSAKKKQQFLFLSYLCFLYTNIKNFLVVHVGCFSFILDTLLFVVQYKNKFWQNISLFLVNSI